MKPRLASHLRSALLGLLVGFVWESFGAVYLWTLASPQVLVFGLAMILWPILGLVMAALLRVFDAFARKYKILVKPLVGTAALFFSGTFRLMGMISFRGPGPYVLGVPLYMMTGSLALVYLLDLLKWYR
jgi:hypothetical protein